MVKWKKVKPKKKGPGFKCANPACDEFVDEFAPAHHNYCILHAPTIDPDAYDGEHQTCRVKGCKEKTSAPHRFYCDECYLTRYRDKAVNSVIKDL